MKSSYFEFHIHGFTCVAMGFIPKGLSFISGYSKRDSRGDLGSCFRMAGEASLVKRNHRPKVKVNYSVTK